jgi:hypothetical protein
LIFFLFCSISNINLGRRVDVERAIELIAKRFPSERYPQVVFKPINKKIILRQRAPECIPIPSNVAQVKSFRIEIQKLIFLLLFKAWFT